VARRLLYGAGAPDESVPEEGPAGGARVASKFGQDAQVDLLLGNIAALKLQHPLLDPPTELYGGSRAIDYSQFRPRGHYVEFHVLERYFRTMAWLGRADPGWNVLPVDPRSGVFSDDGRELRDAVLFVELLRETGGDERLAAIGHVMRYLVGSSDFLGVQALGDLMGTWQRKQLQTQLASWSQLRRDTVLYSKQSFTAVPGCEYPSGYVGP
jgi:hypothetical protein